MDFALLWRRRVSEPVRVGEEDVRDDTGREILDFTSGQMCAIIRPLSRR